MDKVATFRSNRSKYLDRSIGVEILPGYSMDGEEKWPFPKLEMWSFLSPMWLLLPVVYTRVIIYST
jgi:hypothetical protein